MKDQAHYWSRAAGDYEQDFIDPDLPAGRNRLRETLLTLAGRDKLVADLGCGIGPLLPFLAEHFGQVFAVDFAEGMLARARERCQGLANVAFYQTSLTDLAKLTGRLDVAVAVNSLIQPDVEELERALQAIHATLRPGGYFLGIVPAIDSVHYLTMLLLDRARATGMPPAQARLNAAHHAEHALYDFAFGQFHYKGLHQHFWQPFEVPYRLHRAGFHRVHQSKFLLAWEQFGCGRDLHQHPRPWDWFFHARA